MTLPTGLRWHLWYRRQLRRLHIMRPLAPPSRCIQCDTPFNVKPCWSLDDDPRILCAPCRFAIGRNVRGAIHDTVPGENLWR